MNFFSKWHLITKMYLVLYFQKIWRLVAEICYIYKTFCVIAQNMSKNNSSFTLSSSKFSRPWFMWHLDTIIYKFHSNYKENLCLLFYTKEIYYCITLLGGENISEYHFNSLEKICYDIWYKENARWQHNKDRKAPWNLLSLVEK